MWNIGSRVQISVMTWQWTFFYFELIINAALFVTRTQHYKHKNTFLRIQDQVMEKKLQFIQRMYTFRYWVIERGTLPLDIIHLLYMKTERQKLVYIILYLCTHCTQFNSENSKPEKNNSLFIHLISGAVESMQIFFTF